MEKWAAAFALFTAAFAASPVYGCALPWTPPPYAEALRQQVSLRQNSETIELARVVEGRIAGEKRSVRFYRTIVAMDDQLRTEGLRFAYPDICEPNPEVGDLVLIYYNRVDVLDPDRPDRPLIDYRVTEVLELNEIVDPEIGVRLRQTAAALNARAARMRARAR